MVFLPGVTGEGSTEHAAARFVKADSVMPVKVRASASAFGPADKMVLLLSVDELSRARVATKGTLGFSQKGRMITAWYFPGTSDQKALVIGGMHGSELSSIAVGEELIRQLQHTQPYYSVIIIPCLFPDNAEAARNQRARIGSVHNTGRYSHPAAADPNRQMPSLGKAFDPELPLDHMGRTIEQENQLLLTLIAQFRPNRIANIHAIRDAAHAGIYADPRTNSKGIALGFATDSSLAVDMAMHIAMQGGMVPGNRVHTKPTALYYKDPEAAVAGQLQKRNTCGSKLPLNRGQGISLGGWASTSVEDTTNSASNRPAMRLITIEFPGYKAPADYTDEAQQLHYAKQVDLYAAAIVHIFLGQHYPENHR